MAEQMLLGRAVGDYIIDAMSCMGAALQLLPCSTFPGLSFAPYRPQPQCCTVAPITLLDPFW